jgi:glycerate dehydrogenase
MDHIWKVYNASGTKRILVTSSLPGEEWLTILSDAGYRIEVRISGEKLSPEEITGRIGNNCTAIIGQLTEKWSDAVFSVLSAAGGVAYCNYAVGYDNVDIDAASKHHLAVGNTPGVLTEATAELAVALTMACSRRITEADEFTRNGMFKGWSPDLFLGNRLWQGTLGVIGAGRIGSSYALMMVRAFQMNIIYFSRNRNNKFENELALYNEYLQKSGWMPVNISYAFSVDELLQVADVVSLHVPLTTLTRHLISNKELLKMKPDAILINTSRGPVIDETALTEHCRLYPDFKAGLDVYEYEPAIDKGLMELHNVTLAPHIGSATGWTRENMSKLAALNIKGVIEGYPVWDKSEIEPFLSSVPPKAIPSIVNRSVLSGL